MAKLTADSLLELSFIADPAIAPGGQHAVAVHSHIHPHGHPDGHPDDQQDSNAPPAYHSQLHLYNLDTGISTPLTTTGTSNVSPAFSPDGTQVAFLSDRAGDSKQLCVMPLSGGEAKVLTHLKRGVMAFCWHPDGKTLFLLSRGDDTEPTNDKPKVISRPLYKWNGVGFLPTVKAKIYQYDMGKDKLKVLFEPDFDASALTVSDDGKALFFVAAPDADAEDHWQKNLYRLTLAKKNLKTVAAGHRIGSIATRGDDVVFCAPSDPANFGSPMGLWYTNSKKASKHPAQCLSGERDVQPSVNGDSRFGTYSNDPVITDAGVLVNLNDAGQSGLAVIDHKGSEHEGAVTRWQDDVRAITSFAHDAVSGVTVFTAETTDRPGELFMRNKEGKESQLSHLNAAFNKRYRLQAASKPQTTQADSSDSKVDYWTLAPSKARKDNAMVVQVHGGPHTNYGYGFVFEFQLLAAKGYTVVYGNPRSSSSYGSTFATIAQGDYGGVDAADVMAIATAARANHTDPDAPIHLTGGSYGGFMTNWLIGQTDMFRSAVTQRSICNWLSFYGSSDIGYVFADREVMGNPWDDTDKLWQQSPLRYVNNIKTPLLIIHAEEDHRCPIEQAEQMFIALKTRGVVTELIRYPDESHELSRSGRPDRRIHRLEAILDWFGKHA
jgi:dipeptidyl aminopeptidase/acylaminoacyl peptidase